MICPDVAYCKLGLLKQKIQKSLQCLMMFLRYLYKSTMIHDDAITVLLPYYGSVTT